MRRRALQFEHLDNAPWRLSLVWHSRLSGVLPKSKPIIGADFLRYYGLLVDLKCNRFMDAETVLRVTTSYRRPTVYKPCALVKNDGYS